MPNEVRHLLLSFEYKRGDPSSLLLLGVTMGRNVPWSDKKKVQNDRKTY
jgi:hypothetical protein